MNTQQPRPLSEVDEQLERTLTAFSRELGQVLRLMRASEDSSTRKRAERILKMRGYLKHRMKIGAIDQAVGALSEIIVMLGRAADSDKAGAEIRERAADAMFLGMSVREYAEEVLDRLGGH